MKTQRKRHSAETEAKVALEAIKGQKTAKTDQAQWRYAIPNLANDQTSNQAAYSLYCEECAVDYCTASQYLLDEDNKEYTEDSFP